MDKQNILIKTLGCRLNRSESDGIAMSLERSSHFRVLNDEEGSPDVILVNTCTVTDKADSRSRAAVRSYHRAHPQAKIVLTGCYSHLSPGQAAALPGVVRVIPNDQKQYTAYWILKDNGFELPELLDRFATQDPFSYTDASSHSRSRAQLKIQDGCDVHCSYCAVPAARGSGVSRDAMEILRSARNLEMQGFSEIVLTGVNIGRYSSRLDGVDIALSELVAELLSVLKSTRVRISSIEPDSVDDRLIDLLNHPQLCNFLHIPLQSGSDPVLKRMGRNYSTREFADVIDRVRKRNRSIYIGTDVMVGFPGESDTDFQASLKMIQECKIQRAHVFRFSPRENTTAASMTEAIPVILQKERSLMIAETARANHMQYIQEMIGDTRVGIVQSGEHLLDDRLMGEALSEDFVHILWDKGTDSTESTEYKKRTASSDDGDDLAQERPGDPVEFRITEVRPDGTVVGKPVRQAQRFHPVRSTRAAERIG